MYYLNYEFFYAEKLQNQEEKLKKDLKMMINLAQEFFKLKCGLEQTISQIIISALEKVCAWLIRLGQFETLRHLLISSLIRPLRPHQRPCWP